ncbi:MAG TPA: hypothetical protein PKK49_15070, partial [Flavobacteriales bacterium]|nr:hypothetical protein [Flavobacteriales bacterium]
MQHVFRTARYAGGMLVVIDESSPHRRFCEAVVRSGAGSGDDGGQVNFDRENGTFRSSQLVAVHAVTFRNNMANEKPQGTATEAGQATNGTGK